MRFKKTREIFTADRKSEAAQTFRNNWWEFANQIYPVNDRRKLNKLILKLGLLKGLKSPNSVKEMINLLGTDILHFKNKTHYQGQIYHEHNAR